jgi:hypothetical protein
MEGDTVRGNLQPRAETPQYQTTPGVGALRAMNCPLFWSWQLGFVLLWYSALDR